MPVANPRGWFQRARIFEVQPPFYCDSDGDGIGDVRGITQRLRQIADDGWNVVWVTPVYASPMRDGGYDVSDHKAVNPLFGTVEDLRELCREAERFGIAILGELVFGHTSDQHPWFQASRDPDHPDHARYRDYYHWTDRPDKWAAAPLTFPEVEPGNTTFDRARGQSYYHVFYHFQPALNFRTPAVQEELKSQIAWCYDVGMRVLRFDAMFHWWEEEDTDCIFLPGSYELFREIAEWAHEQYPDLVLLAEAEGPIDKVTRYQTYSGFDAVFDLRSHAEIYSAYGEGIAAPFARAVGREAAIQLRPGQTRVKTPGVHDEVTSQFRTRAARHAAWHRYLRRSMWGVAARPMDLADLDLRAFRLLMMAHAILPGAWSMYQGNDLGLQSARPDQVRLLPGEKILDARRLIRTLYPSTDERGHGFSTANPRTFLAPMVTEPYGSRAHQLNLRFSPVRIVRGINRLREEHGDLFCTGSLELIETYNPRVSAVLRRAPSAAGGTDGLLGILNWGSMEERFELALDEFDGWEFAPIHTEHAQRPTSDPWCAPDGGRTTFVLQPYGAAYYLMSDVSQ